MDNGKLNMDNISSNMPQAMGEWTRRAPRWMTNYEIWEGLFKEENLNLMLMMIEIIQSHLKKLWWVNQLKLYKEHTCANGGSQTKWS